jgi:hypothetical protein
MPAVITNIIVTVHHRHLQPLWPHKAPSVDVELVDPVELEVGAAVNQLLLPPNPPKHNHLPRS